MTVEIVVAVLGAGVVAAVRFLRAVDDLADRRRTLLGLLRGDGWERPEAGRV